jgi:FkbM family methyltransferase
VAIIPSRAQASARVMARSPHEVVRDAHRPGSIEPGHHWVFDHFPPWPHFQRARHQTGYLGETFPGRFVKGAQVYDVARRLPPDYPWVESEYYELTDLLEAALDAGDTFTFIEAGAGFGRWSARAAIAARRLSKTPHVVMIEGDPVHARWAHEMMELNGIDEFRLIEAAVAGKRGKAPFLVDVPEGFFRPGERTTPAEWYGQSLASSAGLARCDANSDWRVIEVDTVTLADVLADLDHVDLIDFDIQGAEGEVIAGSLDLLTRRVRRLCIETHAGWMLLRELALNATTATSFGAISMPSGGLQSWVNPRLYKLLTR